MEPLKKIPCDRFSIYSMLYSGLNHQFHAFPNDYVERDEDLFECFPARALLLSNTDHCPEISQRA